MRRFLLLLTLPLFAEVPLNIAVDPQIMPTNNVNVVTGDYINVPTDYVTNTLEPIPIRRIHVSGYHPNGHFGEWRFQMNRLEKIAGGDLMVEEDDGSVAIFNSATGTLKSLGSISNTSGGSIGGKTDMRNWILEEIDDGYLLTKGDGTTLQFDGEDKVYLLTDKRLPSGNHLLYTHDDQDRPTEIRLVDHSRTNTLGWVSFTHSEVGNTRTIHVNTSDHRSLTYIYQKRFDPPSSVVGWLLEKVTFPDGNVEEIHYNGFIADGAAFPISTQNYADGSVSNVTFTSITNGFRPPSGRTWRDSPSLGRVYKIQEPVGSDNKLHVTLTFKYGVGLDTKNIGINVNGLRHGKKNQTWWIPMPYSIDLGWRDIYDAYEHRTRYYVKDGRVESISGPSGRELRCWGRDANETYLLAKTHQNLKGEIVHSRTFTYDTNGNIIAEHFMGNLTGTGTVPIQIDHRNHPYEQSLALTPGHLPWKRKHDLYCLMSEYFLRSNSEIAGVKHRCEQALVYMKKKKLYAKYFPTVQQRAQEIARAYRACYYPIPGENKDILEQFLDIVNCGDTFRTSLQHLPVVGTPETYTKHSTYSDDGFNNLLSETDGDTTIHYTYKPGTDLITSRLTYDPYGLQKEEHFEYDHNTALTQLHIKHGSLDLTTTYESREDGLPQIIHEPFRRTHLHYDEHNQVIQKDIHDAHGIYQYSVYTDYDKGGRVIREVDALGQETLHKYDKQGNRVRTQTPRKEIITTYIYDFANRLIATTIADTAGNSVSNRTGYDLMSRKTSETDECGNAACYEYDAMSNLKKVTHPPTRSENGQWGSHSITRTYDSLGNILTETDENDYTTTYEYNARKQPIAIHHPDDTHESFTYKLNGHLKSHTHKNGSTAFYTRDYLGRVLTQKLVAPDGSTISETYTTYDGPNKASHIDGEGHTTTYSYDRAGRLIQETKGNQTISYSYDSLGRLTRTQKGDRITILAYDLLDRVTEQRTEDTSHILYSLVRFEYDGDGNKITTTTYQTENEPLHTQTTYDLLGKPISITDSLGNTSRTIYERDYSHENQQVLRTTHIDANGLQTITIHDPCGKPIRVEKKTFATLALTDIQYDRAGNRIEQTHTVFPSKRTTTTRWEYGPLNRIEALFEPDSKTTRFTYSSSGELETTIKPSAIELHRAYDSAGRLLTHSGPDFTYTYSYDHNNQPTEITSQTGTTTRTYDANQHITSETLETGLTLSYTYDEQGRRLSTTLPDESQIHYTYNAAHLTAVTRNGYTHSYLAYDLQNNLLQEEHICGYQESYTYDDLGRLTSNPRNTFKYDPVGNLTETKNNAYTYDDLNQLTSENDHTYSYDSLHNRTSHNKETYQINSLNQPTHLPYDADGRLLSHNDHHYTYDSLDRLTSVETPTQTVHYTYDPFNRRLSKNDTTFIYDHQCEIGAITNQTITQLRVLGRSRGAEIGAAVIIELDNYAYTPLHDHRGSVTSLLTTWSRTHETYTYTAYGESPEPSQNPYRFLSKRHDPESNLTYFGRRYYNPTLGRWISPDPKGYSEGPNLYAYVLNNPLTNVDLWGLAYNPLTSPFHKSLSRVTPLAIATPSLFGANPAYREQPRNFSTGTKRYGRPIIPLKTGIGSSNGIKNNFRQAFGNAEHISQLSNGHPVAGTHRPTRGLARDLFACHTAQKGAPASGVQQIASRWLDFIANAHYNAKYLEICHSGGAIAVRQALLALPERLRERIMVLAIAPADHIDSDLCFRVDHYESKRDFVPFFSPRRDQCLDTIHVLDPHSEAPLWDHTIQSPTYADVITLHTAKYQREYGGRI